MISCEVERMSLNFDATCFVCDRLIKGSLFDERDREMNSFEQHLLCEHDIVIPKFEQYADLQQYLESLQDFQNVDPERMKTFTITRYNKNRQFQILDRDQIDPKYEQFMRSEIEKGFLARVLTDAQNERHEVFNRECLFCRKFRAETRAEFFEHLHHDHNLMLGHPDNIVDANEFIDLIQEKLNQFKCLYCEKDFKNWNVLKEHMRKKSHKMLNPDNREYDRFYLINYLCSDKHWKEIKEENDGFFENFDEEWRDWIEKESRECQCFFCDFIQSFEPTKRHLMDSHGFDFDIVTSLPDFYDRIKMINFIRSRVNINRCHVCDFDGGLDSERFEAHLRESDHARKIPTKILYNAQEYYFPTCEDDGFLFYLDDFNDLDSSPVQELPSSSQAFL